MRIVLAGPDYEENLSVRYLSSSLLAAGHETVLAAFNSPADTMAVVEAAQRADIAGLSLCFQSRAQEFLRLAQAIKSFAPKTLVVAGGHYASCAAEPLLAHHPEIDIVVVHEGEAALVEIADAVPHLQERLPQIPGIAYRDALRVRFTQPRGMLDDLDALPFPDRRGPLHTIAGVPTSYLMGSRGCYGNCAYCCITTLHRMAPGKRFRQRRVERIADEMALLYRERGTRQFVFHDDNFLVPSVAANLSRIGALEKALTKRGLEEIALVIKCRPADANYQVLQRLKGLGLVRVFLGIESATAQGLSTLERKQTVGASERALEVCAELGISAQFTLMVFHPAATPETLRSDIAFMRRFSGNPLNFCRAEIYAGTPLEERMIELGRARGNYLSRVYGMADPVTDLACNLSLELFGARCWGDGSLMQSAIGLDHVAAIAKRFYRRPEELALCPRIASWRQSVNLDTVARLEEAVELAASTGGRTSPAFERAALGLREREAAARRKLFAAASGIEEGLRTLRFTPNVSQVNSSSGTRRRLARQAAAAALAVGIHVTTGCYERAPAPLPPPPPISTEAQTNLCSLAGTVTDAQGTGVHAVVTITNLDTGLTRAVTTDNAGRYVEHDLSSGRYSVKAEATAFKAAVLAGIALKAGDHERADIHLVRRESE